MAETRPMRCARCKASTFEPTPAGMLICVECGTQVRGVVEEILSHGEGIGFSMRHKRKADKKQAHAELAYVREWPTPALVFETFQYVLHKLVDAVGQRHPASAEPLASAVRELWFRTLQLFPEAAKDAPVVKRLPRMINSKTRPQITLGPLLAAMLTYIGGVQLKMPLHLTDVKVWCESVELLGVRNALPSRLHLVSATLPDLLRRGGVHEKTVRESINELIVKLNLCLSPPPPASLLCRFSAEFGLPPALQHVAASVVAHAREVVSAAADLPKSLRPRWPPSNTVGPASEFRRGSLVQSALQDAWLEAASALAFTIKLCYDMTPPLQGGEPHASSSRATAAHVPGVPRWEEVERALVDAVRHRELRRPPDLPDGHSTAADAPLVKLTPFPAADATQVLLLSSSELARYLSLYGKAVMPDNLPSSMLPVRSGPLRLELQEEMRYFADMATSMRLSEEAEPATPAALSMGDAPYRGGEAEAGAEVGLAPAHPSYKHVRANVLQQMPPRCALTLRGAAVMCRTTWEVLHSHLRRLEKLLFPWPALLGPPYSAKVSEWLQRSDCAPSQAPRRADLSLWSDDGLVCASCACPSSHLEKALGQLLRDGWWGVYSTYDWLRPGWLQLCRATPSDAAGCTLMEGCMRAAGHAGRCTRQVVRKGAKVESVFLSPAGDRFINIQTAMKFRDERPSLLTCSRCERPAGGPLSALKGVCCECHNPLLLCADCRSKVEYELWGGPTMISQDPESRPVSANPALKKSTAALLSLQGEGWQLVEWCRDMGAGWMRLSRTVLKRAKNPVRQDLWLSPDGHTFWSRKKGREHAAALLLQPFLMERTNKRKATGVPTQGKSCKRVHQQSQASERISRVA